MRIPTSVVWAMPSAWTFSIPPIAEFVWRWTKGAGVIVDPFCGQSKIATHRNDWGQGGVPAEEFLDGLLGEGLEADAVLFDPPYSPRQISECYQGLGLKAAMADTQNAALYSRVRPRLAQLCKPGGIALCFGWQSAGLGKAFGPIEEILLVQHGGGHNDTICVAQRHSPQLSLHGGDDDLPTL